MRISDWSSDVCSSDLVRLICAGRWVLEKTRAGSQRWVSTPLADTALPQGFGPNTQPLPPLAEAMPHRGAASSASASGRDIRVFPRPARAPALAPRAETLSDAGRSEEPRGGKGWGRTGQYR